jgi:hypothetical protein
VDTVGGFGDPPDRMIIERKLHDEDVAIGSSSSCEALCEAVKVAQTRWLQLDWRPDAVPVKNLRS